MKRFFIAALCCSAFACSDSKDSKKDSAAEETPAPVVPVEPAPVPTPKTFEAVEMKLDASKKGVWVYFGWDEGKLVPVTKEDVWMIGVSRYMFQTNSGSSGAFAGGAYASESAFEAIQACDTALFVKDQVLSVAGFTASVNLGLTEWFDQSNPVVTPLDTNFLVGREQDCLKLRILSYDQGLYQIKIQRL